MVSFEETREGRGEVRMRRQDAPHVLATRRLGGWGSELFGASREACYRPRRKYFFYPLPRGPGPTLGDAPTPVSGVQRRGF